MLAKKQCAASSHRLLDLFPCPFRHDTTLQHYRLLSIAESLARWGLLKHAMPARRRRSCILESRTRSLAPTPDLGVHAHPTPVFWCVPADLLLGELIANLCGTRGLCEVDQVYVLMPRFDVLKLHPGWSMQLQWPHDILAPLPHQLNLHLTLEYP
jgi:hypothetical protein